MSAPSIVSTSPVSEATGITVNTSISVIFDQEVDTFRLKNGGIFIEGPDESKSIGPGFLDLYPPETDEDKFLQSPGYKGIITDVGFEFKRVDGSGAEVSYYDYGSGEGAGSLYRTKVILTPTQALKANTLYTVYIVGDSDITDGSDFGLSDRTVFDTIVGSNIGNGTVLFYGGYTGTTQKLFTVEVTGAGVAGVATFEWWTNRDETHRTAISSIGYRLLEDGVKIKFNRGLNFSVGDRFQVWCDVPTFMEGSYKFSFTTSDQSPETLPAPSTLITGSVTGTGTGVAGTSNLSITSISPDNGSSMNPITTTAISIVFGNTLDATTVTDSTISIIGNAADGSYGGYSYTSVITKSLAVSDNQVVITLDSDQLFVNNIIIIQLDSSISDIDGNSLGSNQEFYFGTTYTPFYVGERYVLLKLGPTAITLLPETIAFAIWEASKEADAFAPVTAYRTASIAFQRARREFVACYAAWTLAIILSNTSGQSIRKRLSDFDVSRGGSGNGGDLDDSLKDCWQYYRELMQGNGDLTSNGLPQVIVKGGSDPDNPTFGRLWDRPNIPLSNMKVKYSGTRRWLNTNSKRYAR